MMRKKKTENKRNILRMYGEEGMEMDRMRGRTILKIVLLCTLLCFGVTACGSDTKDSVDVTDSYQSEKAAYGLENNMVPEEASDTESGEQMAEKSAADASQGQENKEEVQVKSDTRKKVIKTYYYDYETESFDESYAYLKEQIETFQGYISSSSVNGTNYRSLQLTARIPADVSDEFTGELGSLGTVVSQSESAEDVTLQYTDTESRIAALKTEHERLNELLGKADSLETIIALEDRLTEVRYELESYQSRKNLLDDRISYSTVNITLKEVNYTVAVDDSTFFSRVASGLESSFRDIREGFVDFLVALIVALPYLVIWGIILFAIVRIVMAVFKHRRKKKQASHKQEEILREQSTALQENENK